MKIILVFLAGLVLLSCSNKAQADYYLKEEVEIKRKLIKHLEKDITTKVRERANAYGAYYDKMKRINSLFDSCIKSDKPVSLAILYTEISEVMGTGLKYCIRDMVMQGTIKDTGIVRENRLRCFQCQVLLSFMDNCESYVIRCFAKEHADVHLVPESYKIKTGKEYVASLAAASYYGIYEGSVIIDSIFRDGEPIDIKPVYKLKNSYNGILRLKPDKPGLYYYKGRWECHSPQGPNLLRIEGSFIAE